MGLGGEFGGRLGHEEDAMPAMPTTVLARDSVVCEEEIEEERRLEKRSKDMLRRLRAHVSQHGWGESGISLLEMCEGNTKKQVRPLSLLLRLTFLPF